MKFIAILLVCVGCVLPAFSEVEYGNLIGLDKITLNKGDVFTLLANDLYKGGATLVVKFENRTFYTSGKMICGPCVISISKGGHFCSYQVIRSASEVVQVVTSPVTQNQ